MISHEHYMTPFSTEFCSKWSQSISKTMGWKIVNGWSEIREISDLRKTFVYCPNLTYCDYYTNDPHKNFLNEEILSNKRFIYYTIDKEKTIDSLTNQNFLLSNEIVTMRLPLAKNLWENSFSGKIRNQIRKSYSFKLKLISGTANATIEKFYFIYRKCMHLYGMPVYPKKLLFNFRKDNLNFKIFICESEGVPISGLIVFYDKKLAWVPWGASDKNYRKLCPNHFLYWEAIKDVVKSKIEIFDFGRSKFGGNTFKFKKQWGAIPVFISKKTNYHQYEKNIYSKAQKIWKIVPDNFKNVFGPILYKYLSDI